MLRFSDAPYRFFPPSYFAPTARLIREANRLWLHQKLLIDHVDVVGQEHLKSIPPGARLVLLANHPTHADASIALEACRQMDVLPRIMTAYDLYLRGTLDGWILKRVGCFSVDREGSDKLAMDEASRTILDGDGGQFHLTMFPEGNVYLENDRITPLHDGAAFLTLRAAKQLAERNGPPVWVVPVSIKATHLTDCREPLTRILYELANHVGIAIAGSPLEALRTIGLAAARRELTKLGIDLPATDELPGLTRHAAELVLERIEPALKITPRPGDLPIDRVRAARRVIHEIRIDESRSTDEHAQAAQLADDAMLAFRLASYSGNYVAERPSLDRIGETCEKLYEDLHDRFLPPYAERVAIVRIGKPIDVATLMASAPKQKAAIASLTSTIEKTLQAGLDHTNSDNAHPGARLWTESLSSLTASTHSA